MKFKVHRLDIHMESGQETLESFLNGLTGEVGSVSASPIPELIAAVPTGFAGIPHAGPIIDRVEEDGKASQ